MTERTKERWISQQGQALAFAAAMLAPTAAAAIEQDAMNSIEVAEAAVMKLSGTASADVALSQSIVGNALVDHGTARHNRLVDSFNDALGIQSVNQSAGDLGNQANIRAIAVGRLGVVAASIAVTVEFSDNRLTVTGGERDNRIVNSFNNTTGIVGVNQSAGSMNSQANLAAIAVGLGPADGGFLSLTDLSLGAIKSGNEESIDPGIPRRNAKVDSFNDFTGVAQVNQVAGEGNIAFQAYVLNVSGMPLP